MKKKKVSVRPSLKKIPQKNSPIPNCQKKRITILLTPLPFKVEI